MNSVDGGVSPFKCTLVEGKTPETGLLVTNHLNLMYMLAAGLIMPPSGFAGKHYRDTLGDFPGWIPLFVNGVPRNAIENATSEAGHLKPCIVEIELSGMSGSAMAFGGSEPKESGLLETDGEPERALLLPAPLPTSDPAHHFCVS